MTEFNAESIAELGKLRADYDHLSEKVDGIGVLVNKRIDGQNKRLDQLGDKLTDISKAISSSNSPNYTVWLQFAMFMIVVGGGLWALAVNPLTAEDSYIKQNIARIESKLDSHKNIGAHANMLNKHTDFAASTRKSLKEIETQFCGFSHYVNGHKAEVHRLLELLWKKAYGETLPNHDYIAVYGNCSGKNTGQ